MELVCGISLLCKGSEARPSGLSGSLLEWVECLLRVEAFEALGLRVLEFRVRGLEFRSSWFFKGGLGFRVSGFQGFRGDCSQGMASVGSL